MNAYTPDIDKLATDWFRRCRESQMVHYEYGSVLDRKNVLLGIPAVLLATIVGAAVFGEWSDSETSSLPKIIFGMLSIASAAFSALQTFLNFSDRAAKHKTAGACYGAIRRRLELLKTMPPETPDEIRVALQEIKQEMDELAATSPGVPSAMKKKIDAVLKSSAHHRIFQLEPRPEK